MPTCAWDATEKVARATWKLMEHGGGPDYISQRPYFEEMKRMGGVGAETSVSAPSGTKWHQRQRQGRRRRRQRQQQCVKVSCLESGQCSGHLLE